MSKEIVDLTFIYSSPCIEALENLYTEMSTLFGLTENLDDMFYYGVFCKPETYADFDLWDEAPLNINVPDILTSACASSGERLDYVKRIINNILVGDEDKPDWMIYVEEELSCNDYDDSPSTFLYLLAKEDKYVDFGDKLLEFLYSPNLVIKSRNYPTAHGNVRSVIQFLKET